METNWAVDHLQTIRTLMERSALYRRALAPIMTFNGVMGIAGTAVTWFFHVESNRRFVGVWSCVALIALAGSFLLVRRQALKDAEPFWSPPTRRVVQAMLPALSVGLFAGVWGLWGDGRGMAGFISLVWCLAYGCALHAAGFFMQRGIRLLGWLFILAGCGLTMSCLLVERFNPNASLGDWLFDGRGIFMGLTFGGLHLACGIYLYFTENRRNET
jgi:hypothetical protein